MSRFKPNVGILNSDFYDDFTDLLDAILYFSDQPQETSNIRSSSTSQDQSAFDILSRDYRSDSDDHI